MHQLSADVARELMPWLDSKKFAEVVNSYLQEIEAE